MARISKLGRARTVGPNIVRAWFDTVINPVLQALKVERCYLEKRNCTWRFRPGGMEEIRTVQTYLELEARDNFEQIIQFYQEVKRISDLHDKNVTLLSEKCSELQQSLQSSRELQAIYNRVTPAKSLSEMGYSSVEQVFGAYPPADHLALLAQYIVNRTDDLPDYYQTARLWNKFRQEFLAILDRPSIRIHSAATDRAIEKLLSSVKQLLLVLEEMRLQLSLEHDVPYATKSRYSAEIA